METVMTMENDRIRVATPQEGMLFLLIDKMAENVAASLKSADANDGMAWDLESKAFAALRKQAEVQMMMVVDIKALTIRDNAST